MPFVNVILSGAVGGVLLTYSGLGAMFGNLAAIVLGRSAETRSEWTAFGGALGCVLGFLSAIWSIANVTRL